MISTAQTKLVRSLHNKKFREQEGLFLAEGPKVVNELVKGGFKVHSLYSTEDFIPAFKNQSIERVNEKQLEAISALTTPNQVVGVFQIPDHQPDLAEMKKALVLAADDIRDPGNMGTMVRIADWFGIHYLLCSKSCVDVYNPKTVQSTMGSLARVQVLSVDLAKWLPDLTPVYAATLDGSNVYKEPLSKTGVLLIGNESRGISPELLGLITRKIAIPGGSSAADSLNAAMATAVLCSEFFRRVQQ